jgi:transposase
MKEYISFDSHKHYTLAEREEKGTRKAHQVRIDHERGAIKGYLKKVGGGGDVAVEAIGNWYWIVDEIERAGFHPLLVHPRKAKLMMGMINKTDKLDVHGLNKLQRNGTLPTVWIPERELRDLRELTRTRIVLTKQRTRLKNRVSSAFAKYGLVVKDCSDNFSKEGRRQMESLKKELPENTRLTVEMLLEELDFVERHIGQLEKKILSLVKVTPEMKLLMTMPGIAVILAATIVLELGDVRRFPSAENLASYSGTTPRVHSSGGKTRYGRTRPDVNRYLKWAFAEAGNSVAVNHKKTPDRHVSVLYGRLKARKGHAKAVGAVARHLAEASFHVLTRIEPYRDPSLKEGRSREVQAR